MGIKEQLVNLILWNGNKNNIKELEDKAFKEELFDKDNGKEIKRRKNESLGSYIDRYSVEIMKNFSKEKYFKFKSLSDMYNSRGDSNDFIITMSTSEDTTSNNNNIVKDNKGKIAAGVGAIAVAATLFKVFSKRKSKNK